MRFIVYRSALRQTLGMQKQWRFRLVAANGRIISHSGESYHNKQDALDTITSIINGARRADVYEVVSNGREQRVQIIARKGPRPAPRPGETNKP